VRTLIIKYWQRLGDVIQCASLGKQLVEQGRFDQVKIWCNPCYHDIFKMFPPTVTPCSQIPTDSSTIFDLEIWPHRYDAYRASEKPWWYFVTSLYPVLRGIKWASPFASGASEMFLKKPNTFAAPTTLVFDTGFSQVPSLPPHKIMELALRLYPNTRITRIYCPSLVDLVTAVHDAKNVVTINTSVDFIADSVRTNYDHVICTGHKLQDDFYSPKQRRHLIQ